jgi:arylsulfatase A-like enzyme
MPSATPSSPGPGGRLAARLGVDPPSLRAVLALLAAVGLPDLGLKLQRVLGARFDPPLGLAARASLLLPELGLLLGLGALALIGLQLSRSARAGLLVPCALGASSVACSCIAHGYFLATGGSLDSALVQFAWARPRETLPIIASSVAPGLWALLVLGPLACLLGPAWLARGARTAADGVSRARLVTCAGACALGFALAGLWRVPGAPPAFVREPSLNLARGYLLAARAPQLSAAEQRALGAVPARPHGASALTRVRDRPAYNVVYIVLESARADSVSPYAPALDNTPALAKFAEQATLVERAYSVVPHTSKSLVAMLCGFEPRTSAELVETQPDGLPGRCLPQLLGELGYHSVFFQAGKKRFESYAQLVSNLGFTRFVPGDDMPQRGFEEINYFGHEDAIMLQPSQQFLARAREPFLAVYLTNASHHPYTAPKRWPHRSYARQHDRDAYLNALGYVDSVMGRLLEQYERAGLAERTLFVVLGDHGEGFGEHGMWTHDNVLYEEGIRIPLLFRLPRGETAAARIAGPVNQLAIVPSVLSVLGLSGGAGSYAAGSVFDGPQPGPLHLACFRNAHCLASVSQQRKLIYHYADRPPQLFDLQADPKEQHNLASEQPAEVARGIAQLRAWEVGVDKLHAQSSQRALERYVQRTPHADMQHTADVRFGPYVRLVGYTVESPRPDGAHVTCYLHVEEQLPEGYHFVLQLRSGFWHARTLDEQPVRGLYPYRRWQPGDYIANFYRTDWPDSWERLDPCLELQDAAGRALTPRDAGGGELPVCVPLTSLSHRTRKAIVTQ